MRLKWSLLAHFFLLILALCLAIMRFKTERGSRGEEKNSAKWLQDWWTTATSETTLEKSAERRKPWKNAHLIVLPLILRLLLKCASFQINFYCTTLFSTATIFVLSWKMWEERERIFCPSAFYGGSASRRKCLLLIFRLQSLSSNSLEKWTNTGFPVVCLNHNILCALFFWTQNNFIIS